MKQFFKWIAFVLFAIVIGLAMAVALTAVVQAQSPGAVVQQAVTPGTALPIPSGTWGYGYWSNHTPAGVYTPTQALPYYSYGPGMMGRGRFGYGGLGMMGPGMHGGMMGGYGNWGYGYEPAPQNTPAQVDEEIQLAAADFRFDPASITVQAGEIVRLVVANKDGIPHNLYGPDVALAYTLLPAGVVQSVTFTAPTTPGAYLATCTFHPRMNLEIVVK